jgi:hypothetical protein
VPAGGDHDRVHLYLPAVRRGAARELGAVYPDERAVAIVGVQAEGLV